MKFAYTFVLCCLLILGFAPLKADIATPGEQDVYIQLMNGKDFPKYKFFIKYQHYTYDMGYQPSGIDIVAVTPGQQVQTGDRGSASFLYARGPKGEWKSDIEVGGSDIDNTEGVEYLLDRIKIVKFDAKTKTMKIQVVERQQVGADGKVIDSIKKGAIAGNTMIWVLPLVCALGLLLFFVFRRRDARAA